MKLQLTSTLNFEVKKMAPNLVLIVRVEEQPAARPRPLPISPFLEALPRATFFAAAAGMPRLLVRLVPAAARPARGARRSLAVRPWCYFDWCQFIH